MIAIRICLLTGERINARNTQRNPIITPCRCLHKDHYCIECIFSKIKGRYDITKAQGMCKLGDWFHKNWITTDEANEMIMSLPKEEREKYIFAE